MRNWKMIMTVCCTAAVCAALSACVAPAPSAQAEFPSVIQVENVGTGQENRKVTVSAGETVKVTPDMAQIVYRIVTEDRDAAKCQEKNSQLLDQVIQYLKDQEIQDNSIKTADFSLDTQYDWSGNRRTLIGYEMSTRLEVTDVPVEKVGSILTGAVSAGASEVWSVSYFSSRYDEAYKEAMEKAMAMALDKAETLAHAGGCQVTDVLGIRELSDNQSGRYVESGISRTANFSAKMAAEQDTAGEAAAVMPGEMEVSADIEVDYLLLPQ